MSACSDHSTSGNSSPDQLYLPLPPRIIKNQWIACIALHVPFITQMKINERFVFCIYFFTRTIHNFNHRHHVVSVPASAIRIESSSRDTYPTHQTFRPTFDPYR
mmetsp:Transcript_18861/g.39550  ORF Transcript_18861/g.39550 Transcript_18861/m.39550 type:complete len:104 (-) Transcript_18861:530-841(-)